MVGGFDAVDASSRQVDQAGRTLELIPPRPQTAGVPANVPPGAAWFRRVPRKDHDGMAGVRQVPGKRHPQKTAPASDDNLSSRISAHCRTSRDRSLELVLVTTAEIGRG